MKFNTDELYAVRRQAKTKRPEDQGMLVSYYKTWVEASCAAQRLTDQGQKVYVCSPKAD